MYILQILKVWNEIAAGNPSVPLQYSLCVWSLRKYRVGEWMNNNNNDNNDNNNNNDNNYNNNNNNNKIQYQTETQ